jgi:hypothetical protein
MASARLADFLTRLNTNPIALEQFQTDPDAAFAEAGLCEEDRAAIRDANPAALRQGVSDEPGEGPFPVIVRSV